MPANAEGIAGIDAGGKPATRSTFTSCLLQVILPLATPIDGSRALRQALVTGHAAFGMQSLSLTRGCRVDQSHASVILIVVTAPTSSRQECRRYQPPALQACQS
jgi:hypothetical protein